MKLDVFPAFTDFHESQLERATLTPLRIEGLSPVRWPPPKIFCWRSCSGIAKAARSPTASGDDIGGILVPESELDWEYVNSWAARLGVTDLLEKAQADAQPL